MNRRRALMLAGGGLALASSLAAGIPISEFDEPDDIYSALRDQPGQTISLGAMHIRIVFANGAPGVDRARVVAWVKRSAKAVSAYFGRYPVSHHGLLVIAMPGDRIGHATTYGYAGSITRIHVGTSAGDAAFLNDWVLVHEMMHAALPDLPRRALWLQEGNATYLEPIARAAVGQIPEAEVWRQSLLGMPRGMARPDEGGMDNTSTWSRLYWGGATFWLLAEIGIHERTGGRAMLRDAMRAVNRESGGNSARWEPEKLMHVGDAATRTDFLSKLYAQWAGAAVTVDLAMLFARLGVVARPDGGVVFDERAPLAGLRRKIVQL